MSKEAPEFIVVEGPIGVGKSLLARRLATTLNVNLMSEKADDNPFLSRFYENPKTAALPMQLHFLFQRTKKIETLKQADMFKPAQVADFLIQKDKLFAEVTLDAEELELYFQVYNKMMLEAPIPDLVIYLQAPIDVLMSRIYASKIDYAKRISADYVQKIADAYVEFFYYYNDSPLLIINTTDFDLTNDVNDYAMLLDYISDLSPGRHYFNPQELC